MATDHIVVVLNDTPSTFVASLHLSWRWILTLLLLNTAFIIAAYACYVVRYQLVHQQFPGRKRRHGAHITPPAPQLLLPVSHRRRLRAAED